MEFPIKPHHLYVYLDIIKRSDKYAVLDQIVDFKLILMKFESFFDCKSGKKNEEAKSLRTKEKKRHVLISSNFLRGAKILHRHRCETLDPPLTKEQRMQTGRIKGEHIEITQDYDVDGETLLLRAMSIPHNRKSDKGFVIDRIIRLLIQECPEMIVMGRADAKGHFTGVTPIHLAILQEKDNYLKLMLDKITKPEHLTSACMADGKFFRGTIMMAGFPLAVAALKFGKKGDTMLKMMLNFKSMTEDNLVQTNKTHDNLVHLLVRHARRCPEKMSELLKRLRFILNCPEMKNKTDEETPDKEGKSQNKIIPTKITKQLLMMRNIEGLTPLQLAAKLEQPQIFYEIINHEVYCNKDANNGFMEEKVYDITEIETLTIPSKTNDHKKDNIQAETDVHRSILEHVMNQTSENAIIFVDIPPIRNVIRIKWKAYRKWFYLWFFLHLFFMSVLTYGAIQRSFLYASAYENGTADVPDKPQFKNKVTTDADVTAIGVISVLVGLFYLFQEIARAFFIERFETDKVLKNISTIFEHARPYAYTNFRFCFVLFALCLIIDFIVSSQRIDLWYDNYLLVFAVILGWYLVLFFLQTVKMFSYFTLLIQKIVRDMLKFAVVMSVFLVAFSTAMFIVMQGSKNIDDVFKSYDQTLVKMLMVMVGLGDIGQLFDARRPVMSVIVFVMFILLTTIMLLNALIAVMSTTCDELMANRGNVVSSKLHCRLQKLSIVLFIEGMLQRSCCKCAGQIQNDFRFESNKWQTDCKRYKLSEQALKEQENAEEEKVEKDTNLTGKYDELIREVVTKLKTKRNGKTSNNTNGIIKNDNMSTAFPQSMLLQIKETERPQTMLLQIKETERQGEIVTNEETQEYHLPVRG